MILNDALSIEEIDELIQRESIDNIVISPGPGTPCSPKDAGINLEIFETYKHIPILGVCFGFQSLCLAHAHASVIRAPEPVHGRIAVVDHCGDALFEGIPSGEDFEVVRYHSLCIDTRTLGDSVIPLAWCTSTGHRAVTVGNGRIENSHDEGNPGGQKILMAARHGEYPHYGVQFHPESIATKYGHTLLDNFRRISLRHMHSRIPVAANGLDHHHSARREGSPSETLSLNQTTESLHVQFRRLEGIALDIEGNSSQLIDSLFIQQGGTGNLFWLDSASKERTRFSFFGGAGGLLWRRVSYRLHEGKDGGILTTYHANGSSKDEECGSIFDWINHEMSAFGNFDDSFHSFPFEFWGGLVGYLGYELKCQTGGSKANYSPNSDACFFVVDRYIAIDHHTHDMYVVAVYTTDEAASKVWVDTMSDAIKAFCKQNIDCISTSGSIGIPIFKERHVQETYVSKIQQCLAALHAGDSYELCLTNMLSSEIHMDPWQFYKRLRQNNPAPYSAFIDFSSCPHGPTICCSSPERFLRGTTQGYLEAKPIKGTAKRNLDDPNDDSRIAQSLYESEKDRAENLMIVDLLRNDLGRVSETGTVSVPGLMQIESFATVHQMVSTIISKKKASLGVGDIVKACFPGGSMTGAPKIRSMEILDTLEEGPRGIYSGSLGFFSWNQAFDLNIVIRSAIFNKDEILIGAGGAIVVQSDPLDEYEEMMLKFQTLSSGGVKST